MQPATLPSYMSANLATMEDKMVIGTLFFLGGVALLFILFGTETK